MIDARQSTPSTKAVLEAVGIKKQFSDAGRTLNVLQEVNLQLHAGEMVAIMGASGSGKSTLLHILGLLDRPTRGSVLVRNRDTHNISEQELSALRNQHFGFVYQFHHLLAEFNAVDKIGRAHV